MCEVLKVIIIELTVGLVVSIISPFVVDFMRVHIKKRHFYCFIYLLYNIFNKIEALTPLVGAFFILQNKRIEVVRLGKSS
jgi:hypothetical protein